MKNFKGFKNLLFILLVLSLSVMSLVGCANDTKVEKPVTTEQTT